MASENGLFGWNLFGNQAPLGERPIPDTYDVHGLKLTDFDIALFCSKSPLELPPG